MNSAGHMFSGRKRRKNLSKLFHLISCAYLIVAAGCIERSVATSQKNNNTINPVTFKQEETKSQRDQVLSEVESKLVTRAIKGSGWEIPGLGESTTERAIETFLSRKISPKINLTEFHATQEIQSVVDHYYFDKSGALIIRPVKYKFNRILRFNAGNRPFCYIVEARLPDEMSKGMPSIASLIYYDEDGDGAFEVFESGRLEIEPRIPSWAMKLIRSHG